MTAEHTHRAETLRERNSTRNEEDPERSEVIPDETRREQERAGERASTRKKTKTKRGSEKKSPDICHAAADNDAQVRSGSVTKL